MAKRKSRKKSSAKRKSTKRKDPKRVRAGKKAAATRRRKHAIRARAAKKAIKKRKRHPKGTREGGRLKNPRRKRAKRSSSRKTARRRPRKASRRAAATRRNRRTARAVGGKFRSLEHRVDRVEGQVRGLQKTVASHSKKLRSHGMTPRRKGKGATVRHLRLVGPSVTPAHHQLESGARYANPFARKRNRVGSY